MNPVPSPERPSYWFRAKRYGWGWGLPLTWQGWVVLVAWFVILIALSPWIASYNLPLFYLFLAIMCAAIIGIAFLKGEPTHWRWGRRD